MIEDHLVFDSEFWWQLIRSELCYWFKQWGGKRVRCWQAVSIQLVFQIFNQPAPCKTQMSRSPARSKHKDSDSPGVVGLAKIGSLGNLIYNFSTNPPTTGILYNAPRQKLETPRKYCVAFTSLADISVPDILWPPHWPEPPRRYSSPQLLSLSMQP